MWEPNEPNHCPFFPSGTNMLPKLNLVPHQSLSVYWLSDGIKTGFLLHIASNSERIRGPGSRHPDWGCCPRHCSSTVNFHFKTIDFLQKSSFYPCGKQPREGVVGELSSLCRNLLSTIDSMEFLEFYFWKHSAWGASQPHLSPGLEQCKHHCVRLHVYVFSMTSRLNLLCLQVGDTFSNRRRCRLQSGPDAPAGFSLLLVILVYDNISMVSQQEERPTQQRPWDTGFSELNGIKMPWCYDFKL